MNVLIRKGVSTPYEVLTLEDTPIEIEELSNIYSITNYEYSLEYCVNIYRNPNQIDFKHIEYIINNSIFSNSNNKTFKICEPIAIVYDKNKQAIGYMRTLSFENSRDLGILSNNRIGKTISQVYPKYPEWHNKYDLDSGIGLNNRMKMVANIALAIYNIHANDKCVVIDLKPENILATATGKITIVNTESFQINEGNILIHQATAYTPNYLAPEAKDYINKKTPIPKSCDYYAASVIFYSILVGIHPFVGFIANSNISDNLDGTTESNMENWLFAYGTNKNFLTIPANSPHMNFNRLPNSVQELFVNAFSEDTHKRPSMDIWIKVLNNEIK